jgi:hypothetical protein
MKEMRKIKHHPHKTNRRYIMGDPRGSRNSHRDPGGSETLTDVQENP